MTPMPMAPPPGHAADRELVFSELKLSDHLTIKNRLLRSSISGTFDEYDGHGSNARLNWEEMFARGGVGAIISSFVPVTVRGRILTRYAMIDNDDKVPFWREVGKRVHAHGCKYVLQLSHSGRQQDAGGVENLHKRALSPTGNKDFFHGILCQAMTQKDIDETVAAFAAGARRAREAGLDGVELHGANGYLITQFLSSGINDRTDGYGGPVENRARFVLEVVRAIRKEAGHDFHLQMKINGADHNAWLYPWYGRGNTMDDTLQVCKVLEDGGKGVNAFHVSSGSTFPHPRNPPGDFPVLEGARWYAVMRLSGTNAWLNDYIFHNSLLGPLFRWWWKRQRGPVIEGINLEYARELKKHTSLPVVVTGGFQHLSVIAKAIREKDCDGVTMARPLIANPGLPKMFETADGPGPGKECTYCNKCLVNDLANPLGCYELSRYEGDTFEQKYEAMMKSVMSVFSPPTYQ